MGSRFCAHAPAQLLHQLRQLAVHVAPFAHAPHRKKVLLAGRRQLAVGQFVARLLEKRPQLQIAGEVRLVVLEARMGLVGGRLAFQRPVARVLHRQGRSDDQDLRECMVVAPAQNHAADARVERQARKLAAGRRQQVVFAQRAQLLQQLIAVGDRLGRRRLEKRKALDLRQLERLHAQDHRGQRRAQDLRVGEARPRRVVGFVIEADADAGGNPAAAPGALIGRGLRDFLHLQLLHLVAIAVTLHARHPAVDHEANARHGERSLGHIGGQHHPAQRTARLENALLVLRRKAGEQGQDFQSSALARRMAGQQLCGVADLAFARQKDQDIAAAGAGALVDRIDDCVLDVAFLVFGHVGMAHGAVAHFDRVQTPRHLDHRRRSARGFEVARETVGIDGGGGDDHLQAGPARQELLQVAQQEVDVERTLVRLVDDERVVGRQVGVTLGFGQQDAVGHQLDVGIAADLLGKADLVAHRRTRLGIELLGDTRGGGARGDAARLGVADQAGDAAPEFEADLGQLCGLARAGFAAHNNHLVFADRPGHIVATRRDRQLFGVYDCGQTRGARGLLFGRERHRARILAEQHSRSANTAQEQACVQARRQTHAV